jgi:HJR/Mrr/RecB family endonuclease
MEIDQAYLAAAIRAKAKGISSLRGGEDISASLAGGRIHAADKPCPQCHKFTVICCYTDASWGDPHHYYDNWCHVCVERDCSYGTHCEWRTQVGQEQQSDGDCGFCGRNVFATESDKLEELYAEEAPDSGPHLFSVQDEIKRYLARHPEQLRHLNPRKFEELVADILRDLGFDTELTGLSRDNGVDIYAYIRNQVTSFLMFVECKRWSDRNVGIEVVNRVLGAATARGAHKAMIVTTSFFTRPAQQQRELVARELELKDYDDLKKWLSRYR